MKAHNGMRPHDVVVLLKIALSEEPVLNKELASSLYISNSEISESLNRSMIAKLISPDKRKVFKTAFYRFIEHGLKYVFPAEPGAIVKGIPTAHSAPVLKDFFVSDEQYVWPSTEGKVRGQLILPLYPNQVLAALKDERLYAGLALIDAIRVGKVREQQKALELLKLSFESKYA
ncbi:hypothetical protein LJ707_06775 [Mucilaginibacter sp. UR6-1]|uniref:hypothetical protein n=1 Tax=Mucilaginibacter sp. UR6-1 TaxID=1435643 RepID=UPI001E3DEB7F|nr:hypothetical protein [Mucilaginibacter sp. UR6-1]MCC8408626.1 hypothetical protein [Mucilaginibacter sp. UR6-1]